MRLTLILLWSTGILLAAILVGCLMLALFFPRDSFEDRLKGSLNDQIRPLRVDFSRVRLFWKDGPGLSVDELRLFASGTQAGHDAFLSAGRLTFRPSLEYLTDRQVSAHFIVESPVFRSDQAEGEVPALAGIVGGRPICIAKEDPHAPVTTLRDVMRVSGDYNSCEARHDNPYRSRLSPLPMPIACQQQSVAVPVFGREFGKTA